MWKGLTHRHTSATMTPMKISAVSVFVVAAFLLSGCGSATADDPKSLTAQAKDNIAKAEKYHKLANEAKLKQASLQGFLAQWIEECKIKGNVLQMGQDGDPACIQAPTPPPTATAPVPEIPGMSRPSTTKTPITPAKQ